MGRGRLARVMVSGRPSGPTALRTHNRQCTLTVLRRQQVGDVGVKETGGSSCVHCSEPVAVPALKLLKLLVSPQTSASIMPVLSHATVPQVKNPWPNVDAHSGVILQYYGITEEGKCLGGASGATAR